MGSHAHVRVLGGPRGLAAAGAKRLAELESLWSRFVANSEISVLNRSQGTAVVVSEETFALFVAAIGGYESSGGLFDPSVHDALCDAGYDRSFEELFRSTPGGDESPDAARAPARAPGCSGIELNSAACTVTLAPGVRFDPGGIGKGLAADIVVGELVDAGAAGALVNVGGDLRCEGDSGDPFGWVISIEDAFDPEVELDRIAIRAGAVATSSCLTRRWDHGDGTFHHLLDPRTGAPAGNEIAAVSVIARDCTQAEVIAKAALLTGAGSGDAGHAAARAIETAQESGARALVTDADGWVHAGASFAEVRV